MLNMFRVILSLIFALVHFGILETASDSICKSLIPGHEFNLRNETLKKCFFPLGDAGPRSTCEVGNKDPNKYPQCPPNSKCGKNPRSTRISSTTLGDCICHKNFQMTSYYTCDPIKNQAEACQTWEIGIGPIINHIDDCDRSNGLRCTDGVCQCWIPGEGGICLLSPGQPCRPRGQTGSSGAGRCIPNSQCRTFGVDTEMGICTCGDGYHSRGGALQCRKLLGFGELCEADSRDDCNEKLGLRCKSGICQCEISSSDPKNPCIIRIGQECQAGAIGASCPENGECVNDRCKCKEGYTDNYENKCVQLRYLGETCVYSTNMCHYESGLTCTKGKCECSDERSKDGKSCILRASSSCQIQTSRAVCTENSICKAGEYSDSNTGSCTCLEGYVASSIDWSCQKILYKGDTCKSGGYRKDNFCSSKHGLDCINSVCACNQGESADGKCKLKIQDDCELGRSYPVCPLNSICGGSRDYKNCECDTNFLPSNMRDSCLPERKYMETCGGEIGTCISPFSCLQGRCQCHNPSEMTFDPDSNRCKSTGSCEADSECPNHSSCEPLYSGSRTKWCKCKEGYVTDSRQLCKAKYLSACSKSSDCLTAKSMDCIDGICRCSAGLNQIYNPGSSECVGMVGSPCGTRNNKCVDSAFCGPDLTCRCIPGSTLVDNGRCASVAKFGTPCRMQEKGCDWSKGLACVDEVCACFDPNLEYLPDSGTCVGKLGSICGGEIIVGKCMRDGDESGFPTCSNYKIGCGGQTSCKATESGVKRCLA